MTHITASPKKGIRNLPLPLIAFAGAALFTGLWAGLLRLGWDIPGPPFRLMLDHGTLMVSGFLGTLISLERAVALSQLQHGRRIFYLTPLAASLGTVSLFLPINPLIPRSLFVLAAVFFVFIFLMINRMQPALHHGVMGLGALLWLAGNGLWLAGLPIYRVVPWWAGFLVFTIAGERLELARVLILSRSARTIFVAVAGVMLVGLVTTLPLFDIGLRITGFSLAALGIWLLRHDIARRTIHQKGITRFIAGCLLPGYVWLLLSGVIWFAAGGIYTTGPIYDAMLHTIFLGFVFSMIFGHAPVIIPAVLKAPVKYSPVFYLHLLLLHLSLILRISGDLFFWLPVRRWGGLLNEVAILLFLVATVFAVFRGRKDNSGESAR